MRKVGQSGSSIDEFLHLLDIFSPVDDEINLFITLASSLEVFEQSASDPCDQLATLQAQVEELTRKLAEHTPTAEAEAGAKVV